MEIIKKFLNNKTVLAAIGLIISVTITIGSVSADTPALNVVVYALVVTTVVSILAEAFRLLTVNGARWQWTRIVSWLAGGVAGTILGFVFHSFSFI